MVAEAFCIIMRSTPTKSRPNACLPQCVTVLWCFFQSWKLSSALAHHLHWLPGHWKHVLGAILYKHTLLQRRAPQAHSTQQQELWGL